MDTDQTQKIEGTSEFQHGATSDKDSTIAKPSDVCCMEGSLHEGKPRGNTTTIADVQTYVVEPPKGKANGHVMLYFPDVSVSHFHQARPAITDVAGSLSEILALD